MDEVEVLTVRQAAVAVCASLTPAKPQEVAVLFERLSLHYPELKRTDREAKLAIEDWLEDLAEYPVDLIREACRLWRNSTQRFFPTPGQLIDPVRPILTHRKALEKRARDYLRAIA
jgi:hypothetical protein